MAPDNSASLTETPVSVISQAAARSADTPFGPVEFADHGHGPAVLSLHGAMGGWDQGLVLARVVGADQGRIIAPSRPGYMGTALTSGRTPQEQADLYAALLDRLEVDRAVLVAVSGGGPSAIHAALRHPDRCRALILVSTCAGKVGRSLPPVAYLMPLIARWPAAVTLMRRRALANPLRSLARSFPDPAQRQTLMEEPVAWPLYQSLREGMFTSMAARIPGTMNDIRVTATHEYPLERVTVPTLVIHGTGDRVLPFDRHGAVLARRISGAELLCLNDGQHAAIFTHRKSIVPAVRRFIGAMQ